MPGRGRPRAAAVPVPAGVAQLEGQLSSMLVSVVSPLETSYCTGTRSANDLVFIGTINGTPIFANRADVGAFRSRLERHLATSTDLGTILRADAELAREMGMVDTYYVAVEPNCVFQPMSVTHFVRRTRG